MAGLLTLVLILVFPEIISSDKKFNIKHPKNGTKITVAGTAQE
jgi:hypothetical protein